MKTQTDKTAVTDAGKAPRDFLQDVQVQGRGTSFWTHVHKYGPTTHRFKPTNN